MYGESSDLVQCVWHVRGVLHHFNQAKLVRTFETIKNYGGYWFPWLLVWQLVTCEHVTLVALTVSVVSTMMLQLTVESSINLASVAK